MKRFVLPSLVVAAALVLLTFPRPEGMGDVMSLRAINLEPSLLHPFGTDGLGRDLLARVQDAVRETVFPLWGLVLLAMTAGVSLAAATAPHPRLATWAERCLLPLTTVPLFIAVFFLAALLEKTGFWTVALPLMALCIARTFLAVRNMLRESQKLGYWQAHALMGGSVRTRFFHYGVCKDWRAEGGRIVFFHLQVILAAETALSYLGFGIAEPQASLGGLLASSYSAVLKGKITFALILVGVFTVLLLLPPSLVALLSKETFRARRHAPSKHPSLGTALRPSALAPRDQSEDPAWENV